MKSLYIIFLLLISNNIYSQNLWCIKGGTNISNLISENAEIQTSYSFGFHRIIQLYNDLSINTEFLISNQGGILRDKPVKNEEFEKYLDSYDIEVKMQLIELSLLLNYKIFQREKLQIALNIGPSWRIGLHDNSRLLNRKNIYDEDNPTRKSEFDNYEFKYILGETSFLNTSGFALNSALSFNYSFLYSELRYSFSLHSIGYIASLHKVENKFHALHILFGFNF